MKGTAILFLENNNVTFLEDVDPSVFEVIKEQGDYDHCNCKLENKLIDFGNVSPVFWQEEEIDWDYGY
ncbi:hypothetical protein D0469_03835 [Peribacillus saganii]|uniref:Uncharacterized protein n=1 Tax=Peribacillus saganii TaxID=2303992 RepID=A0A372LSB4_9BACI|nr:hypothetical protein [Peribacillus saganii]RFU71078.1 hypothetical protein D0469_03835 [Peribacillus saganii]